MGTISLVVGIILWVIFTVLRTWLVVKRCSGFKDRAMALVKFPGKDAGKGEVLLAIAQIPAVTWIVIGWILNSPGYKTSIQTATSSQSIEIGLLVIPVIVFFLLLGAIARKSE